MNLGSGFWLSCCSCRFLCGGAQNGRRHKFGKRDLHHLVFSAAAPQRVKDVALLFGHQMFCELSKNLAAPCFSQAIKKCHRCCQASVMGIADFLVVLGALRVPFFFFGYSFLLSAPGSPGVEGALVLW